MEWLEKQNNLSDSDVSISDSHYQNGSIKTSITLRNGVYRKLTRTLYVMIGIQGTRLYFKEGIKSNGYKCSTFNKKNDTCYLKLPHITNRIELGDYNLEFDSQLGLYFIDVRNKIGELKWMTKNR